MKLLQRNLYNLHYYLPRCNKRDSFIPKHAINENLKDRRAKNIFSSFTRRLIYILYLIIMSFTPTLCIKSGTRGRELFSVRDIETRWKWKEHDRTAWLLGASALLSSRKSTREKVCRHRLRITVVVESRRSPSCFLPKRDGPTPPLVSFARTTDVVFYADNFYRITTILHKVISRTLKSRISFRVLA